MFIILNFIKFCVFYENFSLSFMKMYDVYNDVTAQDTKRLKGNSKTS